MLDWKRIHFGKLRRDEILYYVKDEDWQRVRKSMKGVSLGDKYDTLVRWLEANEYNHPSKVQVTNYVNALSRGGLIEEVKD